MTAGAGGTVGNALYAQFPVAAIEDQWNDQILLVGQMARQHGNQPRVLVGIGVCREALPVFDKQMRGYLSEEAVLVGVESRTSSPVRVPRDSERLESPDVAGLYPCGEGAGYAGGIVSAALDGIRVARAIIDRTT